jgi:hypothetical protein
VEAELTVVRLIVIAVFCLCVGHPGLVFNDRATRKISASSSSDVEK